MLALSISLVIIALMICSTVIVWKYIDENGLVEWMENRRKLEHIRELICEKAEVGDRLSEEEMKILYKLLT